MLSNSIFALRSGPCKWRLALCLLFFGLLFSVTGVTAQVQEVPALTQRVTDLTATLSQEQQAALEARLIRIEQEKGSQVAVLMVATTQPETIEQYAIRVVDVWKLGRKGVDDGLLVLVAKDDRTVRLEVGYGLQGVIPDAIAKRVIEEYMTSYFKSGDFNGGLNAAVDRLAKLIDGEPLPEPELNRSFENMLPLLLFGAVAICAVLRAIFGNFIGGVVGGSAIGLLVWMLGGGLVVAIVLGFITFFMTLTGSSGGFGGVAGGGGFGGGRGGYSGGGGGFGGGGASGRW